MIVNKNKITATIKKIKKETYYKKFVKKYGWDLKEIEEKIKSIDSETFDSNQILPEYDLNAPQFYLWAAKAMLIQSIVLESISNELPTHIVKGTLTIKSGQTLVIEKNLEVQGNLINKGKLIVLGNVTVNGCWVDVYTEISETAIGGNLNVNQSILTEGTLAVGGSIVSPCIYFSFNQGFGLALKGSESKLFVESDHGSSHIFGEIKTSYLLYDELTSDKKLKSNEKEIYENSSSIFNETFLKALLKSKVEKEDFIEKLKEKLYSYLEKKKTVLA